MGGLGGSGGGGSRRGPTTKQREFSFSQNKKKCLEFSETKEYAKIFDEIFARISVKNFKIFS